MSEQAKRAKKYNAFLSYDHDDKWLADELRLSLHSFARPWLARRAVRVYRDESSMAPTHDLWGTIVKAIEDSEHFLLLVSPSAAASDYVQQEVSVFLKSNDPSKLILVLARGELAWDTASDGLLLNGTRVFSNIKGNIFETTPLWEDLSWAEKEKRGEHLSLNNLRFRSVVAGISSRLRGIDKDELDGRDLIEHRKRVWAFRTLFALITFSALIAGQQWYRARAEARTASARALSAASNLLLAREPSLLETSALLAVESLGQETTAEALELLAEALELLPRQIALVRHAREINQVAFTPDAAHLVTSDLDGVKRVWEVASGRLMAETKHERNLPMVTLSVGPDGRFILSRDFWGAVSLWDWRAPPPNTRILVEQGAGDTYFTPDGRHVVVVPDSESAAEGAAISFYEVETARRVTGIVGRDRASGPTVAPEGRQRTPEDATLIRGDKVEIGIPDGDGERYQVVHQAGVNDVEFCPGEAACAGQYVATASDDGTARLWDRRAGLSRGRELVRMSHRGPVEVLAFSPDGKLIATGGEDGTAKVWDYSRAPRLAGSAYIEDPVRSISFDASGDRLLIAEERGKDLHLSNWEVASGKVTREPVEVPLRDAIITQLANNKRMALSPGGRYLVTHSPGEVLIVVELSTRREVARVKVSGEVKAVSFSSDGSRLAASVIPFGEEYKGDGGLTQIIRGPGAVLLWETEGGKLVGEIEGGGENVALSAAGLHVAVFSYRDVSVWTTNGSKPPWTIKENGQINALAFSADGKHLVVCTGTQAKVYSIERGQHVSTAVHRRAVLEATFSADGALLATFGEDLTARIWKVASGEEVWRVSVPEAPIRNGSTMGTPLKLAFSPRGEYLAGMPGFYPSRVRIWRFRERDLIEEARHLLTRNLSCEEWQRYAIGKYRKTFEHLPADNDDCVAKND